jgi:serine/threonine protein kinase
MLVTQTFSTENERTDEDRYNKILLKSGILYRTESPFLVVGQLPENPKIIIYLSVFAEDAEAMLNEVCPLLKAYNTPFKVLENELLVNQCNGLFFSIYNAGKILTFYPENETTAKSLASNIEKVTTQFRGLIIDNCIRIGQLLYYPSACQKISFSIPNVYRIKRIPGIIGKYYLPFKLLYKNPKGDILLGLNLRKLSFTKCLIKQAKADSYTDPAGRNAIHRLLWQKEVIEQLQDNIPTARVINICRKGEDIYLITEFIEGISLREKVRSVHQNVIWSQLTAVQKKVLLDHFLQTAIIIDNIHSRGYVHRDVQINNFIVSDDGLIYIIDFELAYNYKEDVPSPAFLLGTAGFVSPEQQKGTTPKTTEDIFSLGAILTFMILDPKSSAEFSDDIYNHLVKAGTDDELLSLITRCLSENPNERPSAIDIINKIQKIISLIKFSITS